MAIIKKDYGPLVSEETLDNAAVQEASDKVAEVIIQCLESDTPNLSKIKKIQSQMPKYNDLQHRIWHKVLFSEEYKYEKRSNYSSYYETSIENELCKGEHFDVLDTVLDCNVALEDKAKLTDIVFQYYISGNIKPNFMAVLKKVCPILPQDTLKKCFLKAFGKAYLCEQKEWKAVKQVFDVFINETKKDDKKDWLNLSDNQSSIRVGSDILDCFDRTHCISNIPIEQTLFLPLLQIGLKLNFDPNQRQDQKAPFLHQMEEYIGRQFYELNPIDPVFQQAREMLLNAGANFRAEDEWGHRAYFNLYRHRKALGVYVAHGAELEYTDHNGRVRSLLRPRRQGIRDLKEAIMRAGNTPEARQMRTRLGKLENADAEHARHLTVWTSRIRLAYRAEQNDNNPDRTNG